MESLVNKIKSFIGCFIVRAYESETYCYNPQLQRLNNIEELDYYLNSQLLLKERKWLSLRDSFTSDYDTRFKSLLQALKQENYYYVIKKGPLLELYEFLNEKKIDEFYAAEFPNTSGLRITLKRPSETQGVDFYQFGRIAFVRASTDKIKDTLSIIMRFSRDKSPRQANKISRKKLEKLIISQHSELNCSLLTQ